MGLKISRHGMWDLDKQSGENLVVVGQPELKRLVFSFPSRVKPANH